MSKNKASGASGTKCDRCKATEPAPVRVAVLDQAGQFLRADYCCSACVMVDAQKTVEQQAKKLRAILDG